jgi:hypothetical protein
MIDVNVSRKAFLAAVLLSAWSFLPPPAFALDASPGKPQISINKQYVEITVTVDPTLQPFAGLFANCLAEGKAWADKHDSESAAEWRDNRQAFRALQWFYERDYALRSVVGRTISVVRSDAWFDGGAHPNQHVDTILWDDAARQRVSIRPFFNETADNGPAMTALAQLAKLAVASAKLAKGIDGYGDDDKSTAEMTPQQELAQDTFINEGIKPAILDLGPVTLAPSTESGKSSGLTFHYSPYGVGPYVEGPYTVFVPWTAFRQYLSPEGLAIFGGERPESDEKKW